MSLHEKTIAHHVVKTFCHYLTFCVRCYLILFIYI